MESKLTAILCADVYCYSRLMEEDEEAGKTGLSGTGTICYRPARCRIQVKVSPTVMVVLASPLPIA